MELDGIAVVILDLDLLAPRAGLDLVAESTSALPERSNRGIELVDYSTSLFQPPGSWRRPSGIGRDPELSGPLSRR